MGGAWVLVAPFAAWPCPGSQARGRPGTSASTQPPGDGVRLLPGHLARPGPGMHTRHPTHHCQAQGRATQEPVAFTSSCS